MVRNCISNNEDFVPPTQYPKLSRWIKKKPPPVPNPLPYFKPLPIYNENTYGTLKLLYYIDSGDPYQIFKLFWTNELLDKLIKFIN